VSEATFKRLDALSRALLWLWALLALGVIATGGLETQGRLVDLCALGAFVLAFLLSFVVRRFSGIADVGPFGPLRLWMFATLAAFLLCLDASFVVAPKIQEQMALAEADRDQPALKKAQSFGHQMLGLRMLLAVGLGYGVVLLPRRKATEQ